MTIRHLGLRRVSPAFLILSSFLTACGADDGLEEAPDDSGRIESSEQPLGPSPDLDCAYFANAGKDYWFCSTPRQWQQARTKCQNIGLDLVSIETTPENQFVSSHLLLGTWTGATDATVEGQWRWPESNAQFWQGAASGSTVGGRIASWTPGEPNNFLNEDCAATSVSGLWVDEYCTNFHSYVCEGIVDRCPGDPGKLFPGQCGCGTADTDSDGDGTANCIDFCPNHAGKTAPGLCGCAVADVDSDGDGTPDCNDACSADPNKLQPGACGCGVSDADSDSDSTADCNDECPVDPNKVQPGDCGCGASDVDVDHDGVASCDDACPNDPTKIIPGDCGCSDAPEPADASCGDGLCDLNGLCDGQGSCGAPSECPMPDTGCTYGQFAGGRYWFCDDEQTFEDARARCQTAGMELAVIDSKGEDDYIASQVSPGTNLYLGASDAQTEGDFSWLATGAAFWSGGLGGQSVSGRYTNWDVGQPFNSQTADNDCVVKASTGKWITAPCASAGRYVCELVLTCKDLCGGWGEGGCWCDPGCEEFGDCCPDMVEMCGTEPPPAEESCEGFCGDSPGSCWCDPGCEDFGDCCADKAEFCTDEPPVEVEGSCEGLCGGQDEDCFCDSLCDLAGDCCPDKVDFCGDETDPPAAGSCEGLCGGQADTCFCDTTCQEFGDCCPDKIDVCGDDSETPPVVDGSCEGQCGEQAGSCWCDPDCEDLGDCCPDKVDLCGEN